MAEAPPKRPADAEQPAVVKKYANRRLYNTATSSYVTLDELSRMVRAGRHFVVYDAKTGEDLTRSILTQIILEEDSKGRNLLPINFLRQLIGYYDDSLRAFLPRYLELSMENFAANQEQIRRYIEGTFGQFFPLGQFEDMARQNMALFQRAATMFAPPKPSGNAADGPGEDNSASAHEPARRPALRHLRRNQGAQRQDRGSAKADLRAGRDPGAEGVSGLATDTAGLFGRLRPDSHARSPTRSDLTGRYQGLCKAARPGQRACELAAVLPPFPGAKSAPDNVRIILAPPHGDLGRDRRVGSLRSPR